MRYCELASQGGRLATGLAAAAMATALHGAEPPAARLPPPAVLEYSLSSGMLSGTGHLEWRPAGHRYTLALRGSALGLTLLQWSSQGAIEAGGLVPEQFVDRRLTRPERKAEIDRSAGVIRYSGYKPDHRGELPLAGETQDRLSWMIQLPALLAANPALRAPGARITMGVTGARRDADLWTFVVKGMQRVTLAGGQAVDAVYLLRAANDPGATRSEAWLDPDRGFLPVRARLTSADGDDRVDFLLR